MTKVATLLIVLSWMGAACSSGKKSAPTAGPALVRSDTVQWIADFDLDIKPIFAAHCTPCHFPGGKMYAKMPFDNPQTIRDHQDGILRRIKDPAEVDKLRAFLGKKVL